MLPRSLRLRRARDFRAVRRGGRSWSDEHLALSHLPNRLDHNRYGFVVSKRVGKAIVRNRIKRRLRAAVRQRLDGHRPGYDVVIVARPAAATASFAALDAALATLEQRAGLVGADEGKSGRNVT